MTDFFAWLFSTDWLYGVSLKRHREARIWADRVVSGPPWLTSKLLREHNEECKQHQLKRRVA